MNGARSDQTNVTLDGVDNNDQTKGFAFERQTLSFTYDVYRITNSVRFGSDATQNFPAIDTAGSFGNYNQTLMRPRVMEFALRYSF